MNVNYTTGETSEMETIRTERVMVTDRYRTDFGDLDRLARSISEVGLLQPILVGPDYSLIAGERRLRAVQSLNYPFIAVRVVHNLEDASLRLRAERDENTCRKEMTMSELVAIGRRLEELERPKAAERRTGNLPNGTPVPFGEVDHRRTSDVVGEALGLSRRTYDRAKTVIGATTDEDPAIADAARAAVEEMDRTGKVRPAAEKVRAARKPPEKPKAPPRHGSRTKHVQILRNIVNALEGLAIAADEITVLDSTVTDEEAVRLADDLSKEIRSLNRIKTLLKESTK